MANKQGRSFAAGCFGTVVGGILGCLVGGIVARALGFQVTGSAFTLGLDLIAWFCVGGGAFIGAIAGREIANVIVRVKARGAATRPPSPAPPERKSAAPNAV